MRELFFYEGKLLSTWVYKKGMLYVQTFPLRMYKSK